MKAIVFDEHGSIDVLKYRDIEEPGLQPGQVRVAVRACSLNYHDVFTRQGMPGIKVPLPGIPGCDCAGVGSEVCLLYTVDAADDGVGVGLGGRRLMSTKHEHISQICR